MLLSFISSLLFLLTSVQSYGLNQDQLALMNNAVMQSQGNILRGAWAWTTSSGNGVMLTKQRGTK